jgi:imidazolonepropionase-like amidohydrolase
MTIFPGVAARSRVPLDGGRYRTRPACRAAPRVLLTVICCHSAANAQDLWITHVTVVSAERTTNLSDTTVKLHAGRIVALANDHATPAKTVRVIDGRGKFLAPGLIDSHVHLGYIPGMRPDQEAQVPEVAREARTQIPKSYLYFGFTTLVDLNSEPQAMARWNQAAPRPDTYFCGGSNVADGYPMNYMPPELRYRLMPYYLSRDGSAAPAAEAAAHTPQAVVTRMQADGAICLKTFYETGFGATHDLPVPSAATMQQLVTAARRAGLPVLMHANSTEAQRFALTSGADVLAHGLWNWTRAGKAAALTPEVTSILDEVLSQHRGIQPTIQVLYGERGLFELDALSGPAMQKAVPRSLLDWYRSPAGQWYHQVFAKNMEVPLDFPADRVDSLAIARVNAAVRYLAQHDARFLFGSDTPSDETYGNPPGLNGRLEMHRLADAGLTPAQIFKAATLSNAQAFQLADLGSVAVGKRANLLLLDADPRETLEAYEHIEAVILHGEALSLQQLAADGLR